MALSSSDGMEVVLNVEGGKDGVGVTGGGKIRRGSNSDLLDEAVKERKEKQSQASNNGNDSYRFDLTPHANVNAGGGGGGGGGGGVSTSSAEDPPSKLIGGFLHKQQASGEFCLDMDLEMAGLQNETVSVHRNLAPITESPSKVNRVSFGESPPPGSSDSARRRQQIQFKGSPSKDNGTDSEILKCSSRNDGSFQNSPAFKRKSSFPKERNKSRLMDSPPKQQRPEISGRVGRSGQLKSGLVGKSAMLGKSSVVDEDDDDPFLEEDLPEKLKKDKLGIWTLLQWMSLMVIISALVCSLAIKRLRKIFLWDLMLWKWEVLVLVLICGRLVSGWVIRTIVFFIERNFLLRKRVLYFVYGLKKAVQNCLWLGLVLIAWHFLFDKKVERETRSHTLRYVTKVLVCLVVGTLVWLVKTLVLKVLASSFHVSTYFDRIQESLFNQYVIETLSGPPLIEIKKNEEEEGRIAAELQKLQNAGLSLPSSLKATTCTSSPSAKVVGSGRMQKSPRIGTPRLSGVVASRGNEADDGIRIDHLQKLNPKNVSAWNMKRLMNIIRHGTLSTLDEQILDSVPGEDESTKIRSENEAKAAARKIFQNVARTGSRYIYVEDILRFMQEDEALKTMSLFEGASESKKISKSCLKNWVVNAFRERKALALTLNDTKTAVDRLHHIVNILVAIIIVVVWLLILGIATTKLLVFISSQLLLAVFVFGNSCKTAFESIIFLFVIHPFDVGDRCEIDGVQMVVEEMNILTTVFLRYDNLKIIIPNSVLVTKAISNFYRSPNMGDGVEFLVHVATPAEKIALIKQRITSYIENKTEHWGPSPLIVLKDAESLNSIRMAVWPTHTMNHQDMGERFARRSLLLEEIIKIFQQLDIQYRLFPLNINVRSLPSMSSDRLPPSWTS